eukprot:157656-Alexandrium_andersonii.AAC.1
MLLVWRFHALPLSPAQSVRRAPPWHASGGVMPSAFSVLPGGAEWCGVGGSAPHGSNVVAED